MMRGGKALGEGQVIGMRVRDQDHPDRGAADPGIERGQVILVIGAGVDHDDHWARLDDPRIGPGTGIRTRVGSYYAINGRH
jgi:hypothetical protein